MSLPSAHEMLTSFQNSTKWRYIKKSTMPYLASSALVSSCHQSPHLRHLPQVATQAHKHPFPFAPQSLPKLTACFIHSSDLTDKAMLRLWGLRFATQHTPPTLEAWLLPKTNKMFLRNKAICTDPSKAEKDCDQYSSIKRSTALPVAPA